MINFLDDSHRRYNILTGEWMLVSPHRSKRPWQGKIEEVVKEDSISYDPKCYLCAGNIRANGEVNPDYKNTFSFINDFSAIKKDSDINTFENGLLKAKSEKGICKVICYSPNHSLSLANMEVEALGRVIDLWQSEYRTLGQMKFINHVQIFENKGSIMGSSNRHPHGQIWAQYSIPNEALKKQRQQLKYWQEKKQNLLLDYLKQELDIKTRLICQNENFAAIVPFWAIWPYEAMIIPKKNYSNLTELTEEGKLDFAKILKKLTSTMDKIFNTSFPYTAGISQAPTDGDHPEWTMHMSFYPPLLRSATVKKFMVGYEMFGEAQRDITPEMAAQRYRELLD